MNRTIVSSRNDWPLTIYDLWRIFGIKGKPARSCRSPFREDKNPSFSVSPDGLLWRDFATDEGGGIINFIAKAKDLNTTNAGRLYGQLVRQEGRK